jgi:hypothetical protein
VTRSHATPWWLEPGEASCATCLGEVHHEILVHCEACDGPICPTCVVEVREVHTVFCRACADADEEGDG